jgi:hypothetical protein
MGRLRLYGAGELMKGFTEHAVALCRKRTGLRSPRPNGERVPEGRVRGREVVGSSESDKLLWLLRAEGCRFPDRRPCTILRELNDLVALSCVSVELDFPWWLPLDESRMWHASRRRTREARYARHKRCPPVLRAGRICNVLRR